MRSFSQLPGPELLALSKRLFAGGTSLLTLAAALSIVPTMNVASTVLDLAKAVLVTTTLGCIVWIGLTIWRALEGAPNGK